MTSTAATAFVRIEKIIGDETKFIDGYAWDTDKLTRFAYQRAKQKYEVPFEQAAYLVDLYEKENEMLDTFPLAELGYRSLKTHGT